MLRFTRGALRFLIIGNILIAVAIAVILIWSLLSGEPELGDMLRVNYPPAVDFDLPVREGQAILFTVLPVCVAAHLVFTRLLAMIGSLAAGDPFTVHNGDRLRVIGWSLLVIQLCDLIFGAVSITVERQRGDELSGWAPSLTGWLAVLLVFVLARVFREGTRLRDEAELTI